MMLQRRTVLKYSAVATALLFGNIALASNNTITKSQVVICGGGFGGLSVAKHLKSLNPSLSVTVIEQNSLFISCPLSNIWLGDESVVNFEKLLFSPHKPANRFGYNLLHATVTKIDRQNSIVYTNKGEIAYDYLVLSPGISYDYSRITNDPLKAKEIQKQCPPAMIGSSEHLYIKEVLKDFKGGNFVISLPNGVYRCPPGPYERACMVANYFKNNNIDATVVILDPRDKPITKSQGFLQAYEEYGKFIEYIPNATIQNVNLETKTIDIQIFDRASFAMKTKTIDYGFANIIPENRAAKMIDLADIEQVRGGWAKLKDPSFQSVSDEKVFVVGDAINSPYPKSAHIANSCGAIVAHEIVARVANNSYNFARTPSNMCFSMVQTRPKKGIVVHHWVEFEGDEIIVHATESNEIKKETGESITQWYDGITNDIFG